MLKIIVNNWLVHFNHNRRSPQHYRYFINPWSALIGFVTITDTQQLQCSILILAFFDFYVLPCFDGKMQGTKNETNPLNSDLSPQVIQLGLEPDRALKNCPVGNFSEGDRLPRWRVRVE